MLALPALPLDIPIKSMYLVDTINIACALETIAPDALLPFKPGVYMAGKVDPILHADQKYHQVIDDPNTGMCVELPVVSIDDILGVVLNHNNAVVINARTAKHKASYLTTHPTVPARGIRIVSDVVFSTIRAHAAWEPEHKFCMRTLLQSHLKEEYQGYLHQAYKGELDLVGLFENAVVDLRSEVRAFLGSDKWIMHAQRERGTDIIIEKSIDYRIYQWEQEHVVNKSLDLA